jgi:uncharacterized protein YhbP (UPF0306 family)
MDLKTLIQEYMASNTHMQLATIRDGQPWLCTVYFASDDDFCLYWTSARSRRHSLEIVDNPKTAVTIVRDTKLKRALQITGEAHEVADDDLERVHTLYQSKFGLKDYDLDEMRTHKPEGRAYWVFKPKSLSLWDEVIFPNSPKQQLNLGYDS